MWPAIIRVINLRQDLEFIASSHQHIQYEFEILVKGRAGARAIPVSEIPISQYIFITIYINLHLLRSILEIILIISHLSHMHAMWHKSFFPFTWEHSQCSTRAYTGQWCTRCIAGPHCITSDRNAFEPTLVIPRITDSCAWWGIYSRNRDPSPSSKPTLFGWRGIELLKIIP